MLARTRAEPTPPLKRPVGQAKKKKKKKKAAQLSAGCPGQATRRRTSYKHNRRLGQNGNRVVSSATPAATRDETRRQNRSPKGRAPEMWKGFHVARRWLFSGPALVHTAPQSTGVAGQNRNRLSIQTYSEQPAFPSPLNQCANDLHKREFRL